MNETGSQWASSSSNAPVGALTGSPTALDGSPPAALLSYNGRMLYARDIDRLLGNLECLAAS